VRGPAEEPSYADPQIRRDEPQDGLAWMWPF